MSLVGDDEQELPPPHNNDGGKASPRGGGTAGSTPQRACWGGGLPPTCGPAAARAAAAAAAAATTAAAGAQGGAGSTSGGSGRFPSHDRESFARTLNNEELDEVWKGLGEGVSQRGCGSEVGVGFDLADTTPPSPNGTGVSGAFPKLTANVLERHDQLADDDGSGGGGGGSGGGGGGAANVVPIPKKLMERSAEDMENGTSSKKSSGNGNGNQPASGVQQQEKTLLGAIVSYGVLVLWVGHLVFNVLLLWRVVADEQVWALCFLPGVLGILLSVNSCRKSHRRCKPLNADDAQTQRRQRGRERSAPHACALPAHTLLLLAVVVCLGLHASALLFCEKDMLLVFEEETLDPLCDDSSLALPLILDAIVLSVASLKASSLCWAWVLN
ncbi:hypothetical protein Esi_0277_0015 [Ectocarpus siliculosus]|uniref:Transmembrane protein n=1 Tax=Ectocarpus siliculosus TaxID=2880 RepID=D8LJV6_ECTSI|nr:hypothetical protein Esi_0277_0015 [Ectocarpus siliculosus]|eukprot:CBN76007.1 hypothetical protein Esi_0277_0015 [Ectocarpus siliculosus]